MQGIASAPGFVDASVIDAALTRALCMLSTSRREGYGMVVVEASAHATPSVVVAGEDNAAVELVQEGVNGVIAQDADAEAVAAAIVRVHEAGLAMRESTARWFAENAQRLSLESSLRAVLASYGSGAPPGGEGGGGGGACNPAHQLSSVSRAVRSQVSSRARTVPRSRRLRASAGSPSSRSIACAISASSWGSNSSAAPPATSGSEEASAQATGPAGHRLEHGQPEPLIQGGVDEGVRERPQALDLPLVQPALQAHVLGDPELGGARAELRLVPGGVAGGHQQRAALGGDARERSDQREQVLVGPLGGEGQQHPSLPQPEPRAGLECAQRGRAGDGAEPLGHDVDLRGGRAEQLQEVAAGALGDRDHPLGAAHRERHEHPHAAVADAGVGLGEAGVDQVVHGDHPAVVPPRGRGAGEAVHDVHPRARGEAGQQGLLADHPLLAAAGIDGHCHRGQQLAPGPTCGGGLAAEERCEADPAA